jgi:hypothetical protein
VIRDESSNDICCSIDYLWFGGTGCGSHHLQVRADASSSNASVHNAAGGLNRCLIDLLLVATIQPYEGNFVPDLGPKGGRLRGRNNWPDGGSLVCRTNGLRLVDSARPWQTRSLAPTPLRCRSVVTEGRHPSCRWKSFDRLSSGSWSSTPSEAAERWASAG